MNSVYHKQLLLKLRRARNKAKLQKLTAEIWGVAEKLGYGSRNYSPYKNLTSIPIK